MFSSPSTAVLKIFFNNLKNKLETYLPDLPDLPTPFKKYLQSYQDAVFESYKTPEISSILKSQLAFGLEYALVCALSEVLKNFSYPLYFLISWHAFIKFQLRTLSLLIFSSSYLAPYEQDGELIPKSGTERIPLKHLIILNITQPVLLKTLRESLNLISLYLLEKFFISQLISPVFSFGFLALIQGFFLWQYSFTRDGYTPEQSVKILSQHWLQNISLGLLPALIGAISSAYFYSSLALVIPSFFSLFFISHALKLSLTEACFNLDKTNPQTLSPIWLTWKFNLRIFENLRGKKDNPELGQQWGKIIKKFRTSIYFQQVLFFLNQFIKPFFNFINQAFLYSQLLIKPLFIYPLRILDFANLTPIFHPIFRATFPASLSFFIFPRSLNFIGKDLSNTLSTIQDGLRTHASSIQRTQALMNNRFLSPLIRQVSLFTLGNTWTQIIAALGIGLKLESTQKFLDYFIQQLPKSSGGAQKLLPPEPIENPEKSEKSEKPESPDTSFVILSPADSAGAGVVYGRSNGAPKDSKDLEAELRKKMREAMGASL